jgi:outer membrane receptor protein involved in Fe transport
MRRKRRRTCRAVCLSFAALSSASSAAFAQADPIIHFHISGEDLGRSLVDIGKQSRRAIIFPTELTRGLHAPALLADLSVDDALETVLAGTGLSFRQGASGAIVIGRDGAHVARGAQTPHGPAHRFSDKPDEAPGLMMDAIIVTGASAALRKLDTPYAISTLGQANIQGDAPRSMVDLLRSLPGITVENSGGEGGGENVVVRGLPWAGFRLLDVEEDGLPLFVSNYERELNIDEVYRLDLDTTQVELVRGGTAPIFSDNGSGGVLNLITNHGTQNAQGEIEATFGSHDLARLDGVVSGPVTDKLLFSLGGFYRTDNGERPAGFADADKGGQFKIGFTYKLAAQSKLWADFKYLNDKNIFYTDIPLQNPSNGASLQGLISPNYGTLDSVNFQHVDILALNGSGGVETLSRNLADGIHPEVETLTVGGDFDLGAGWKITDRARYVDGSVLFNAILNGSTAVAASLLATTLPQAQAAFPTATSLRYVYAGTNTIFDPASTANLTMTNTWETTTTKYTDLINSFRVLQAIRSPTYGAHDLTLGVDMSYYTFSQAQLNGTIVTDVKSQPNLLDIQALNPSGQVVGQVTDGGFSSFGGGDLIGEAHGLSASLYGLETWRLRPDIQLDIGVRHEVQQTSGYLGLIGTETVASTGPLAARILTGLVGWRPYSRYLDGTSWTAGAAYTVDRSANIFVRYSSAYSLPRLSDQWGSLNDGEFGTLPNGRPIPTTRIGQAESGVKYASGDLQLAAISFWSHFRDLNASTYVTNSAGQLVNQSLLIDTTTYGVELEGAWRPKAWFELTTSATLQNPTVDKASTFSATVSAASITGKSITRTPTYTISVQPTYFFNIGPMTGRIYISVFAEAKRYQDFINDSVLPAYQTLDFGSIFNLRDGWGLDMHVLNLTNSVGLTEGNARAPLANSLTADDSTSGRPIFGRSLSVSVLKRW